jgi:GntR family transcriptional regulator
MSPRAQRNDPLHIQIADHFKEMILSGELQPGDQLPSIRAAAAEWGVGQQTAQRAYQLLEGGKLVTASAARGTRVAEPRNTPSPAQRLRAARPSGAERTEVLAAELVRPPAYIVPVLGVPASPGGQVVRREWRTSDSAGPFMLSVSWTAAHWAALVPELLEPEPLPGAGMAAVLIAERGGLEIDGDRGYHEARRVLDDGREAPLLGLGPDGFVLAEVCSWLAGGVTLEHIEFIVAPDRVIETGSQV